MLFHLQSETQIILCATQGCGRRGAATRAAGSQGQGEGKAWQGAEQRQPLEERGGDGAQVCLFKATPATSNLFVQVDVQAKGAEKCLLLSKGAAALLADRL